LLSLHRDSGTGIDQALQGNELNAKTAIWRQAAGAIVGIVYDPYEFKPGTGSRKITTISHTDFCNDSPRSRIGQRICAG
jgi:hypothetical protein